MNGTQAVRNSSFIQRHAVALYYALAFLISWTGVAVVAGPYGFPGRPDEVERVLPWGVFAMVLGPTMASLAMTGLAGGRAGYRELWSRLCAWRVGVRWYLVALLATPLLAGGALLLLLPTSPEFMPGFLGTPDRARLVMLALAAGLTAGIFEEIGWTGFVTPRLRLHHGPLATGLVIGFLWGAWHYLVMWWGSGDPSGAFSLWRFLPQLLFYIAVLPAYRLLMVWVYDYTASLPLGMLMHASLTGNMIFFIMPQGISGPQLFTWYLVFAAALWIAVAVVELVGRRTLRHARALHSGAFAGR